MEMVQNWFPKPRWKQYAAATGYVYEYLFEGLTQSPASTDEYSFLVTSGPSVELRVLVAIDPAIVARWSSSHRDLTGTEQYGIAKMALQQALDESEAPHSIPSPVRPAFETIARICVDLDL